MANQIKAPINYPIIAGGKIVSGGSVLFGQPNVKPDEDNPSTLKAVYLDAALSKPAENPQGISSDGVFDQSDIGILYGPENTVYSIVIKGANKKELSYIPEYDLNDANAAAAAQESATEAANSASSALTSKDLVEALYTDFTNRYFGSFSSDPSVDDLGNPPNEGSIYFNSTSNVFFTWTDGAWVNHFPSNPNGLLVTATGTTTPRSLADRFGDTVHVKDEGARPYPFDSTTAIDLAMAKAASMRAYVDLDNLALKYIGSLNIPEGVKGIKGGSSTDCWFGTLDDKKFLKDGEQHNLTGAILFSGTFDTFNTTRADQFSSFTYMVKQSSQLDVDNVAFLQDMIVLDANDNFTTPSNEGYSPCDVGFLIDDVASNTYTNKCVWGYFDKAGTIIYSKQGDDDPDYNIFNGGSTYGRIGFAIIANDIGSAYGLSGTTCFGYKIGSLDHHSRSPADAATLYANADTWRCLYIDGDVEPASTAEINGHYFTNCVLRTRSDTIIELDHASNVVFQGGVIESAKYGVTNSIETKFKGSTNTKKGVQFLGVRLNNSASIFNENFAGLIPYSIIVTGDPVAGALASSAPDANVVGGYAISLLGTDRFTGDPFLLLGKDVNNSNSGWRITRDLSDSDKLEFRWNGTDVASISTMGGITSTSISPNVIVAGSGNTLGIVAGEITVTSSYHTVNTEGSIALDDVDTINGGVSGQRLVIRALDQTRTVVLKNATGNLRLEGDCTLDNSTDTIELIYTGTLWLEISRSNNGA